jgi:hypothetical protein
MIGLRPTPRHHSMLLPNPFCPLSAAKIAGLQATVLLLLTLLIKSRIQIKAASALGVVLLALQTFIALAAMGALGLVILAGAAFTLNPAKASRV